MKSLSIASTGIKKERDTTVRYEVNRMRAPGQNGIPRAPLVEEFYGLDRARIAALAHALDGASAAGDRFTGVVQIAQVFYSAGVRCSSAVIDELDERVASRLLNEVRLPKAGQLTVSVEQLQREVDALRA
jgi:hypothetical protein